MTRVELLPDGQGPLLDRYQIIGRIASGGMGVVWLGRLAGVGGFQRLVAIKQLHPNLAVEPEFVEMFLDEARLAAGIHHQNVVAILEVGTADGGYYLVMEYIEGASFVEISNRTMALGKLLPPPMVLRILLDTLAGLHAAHELTDAQGRPLGLVHRDCTPQNILIGLDGCTKITDFGIARASARLANTREGAFKGKIAYMAPEQTQGDQIDRRADLFSVGVMLWESLTDRRLFKGKTDAQTLTNLLHKPVPRLREVEPDVHPELDAVCAKALARDPADRYQSAMEMADALEQAGRAAMQGKPGDPVASVRALAAYVAEVLGQEITSQRDVVRGWMARAENTPPPSAIPLSVQRPSSKPAVPGSRPAVPGSKPIAPGSSQPPSASQPPGPSGEVSTSATSGSSGPKLTSSRSRSTRSARLPPPKPTLRGWPPTPPPADSEPEEIELIAEHTDGKGEAAPAARTSEDAATAVYTDETRAAMEAAQRPVSRGPAAPRISTLQSAAYRRPAIWPWAVIPAVTVAIIFSVGLLLFASGRPTEAPGAAAGSAEPTVTAGGMASPARSVTSPAPTITPSATPSAVTSATTIEPVASETATPSATAPSRAPEPSTSKPPTKPKATATSAATSAPTATPTATRTAAPSDVDGFSNPYR